MTDAESPEEPKGREIDLSNIGDPPTLDDAAKLQLAVKAAREMGIADLEEIRQLIMAGKTAENDEEIRDLQEQFEQTMAGVQQITELLSKLVVTPTALTNQHVGAQQQLLARLTELLKTATAEELVSLASVYVSLPDPLGVVVQA